MFRVGISRNCIEANDGPGLFRREYFDDLRRSPDLSYDFFDLTDGAVTPAHTDFYDAIVAMTPVVGATSFGQSCRARLLVTTGSGVDTIDIDACSAAGVLVCNTPDGVAKPMAIATLSFILALSHRLPAKDRLTRSGDWQQRRQMIGVGLAGKVVGSLGFGRIAQALFPLLAPLGMRALAAARHPDPMRAAALGVELVGFEQLLERSDFLCLNCPLTEETRGLIDDRALRRMRHGSYLINVSRGPVVDERALYHALIEGRLAGAALDVFAVEPTPIDNPLLGLDNVIATPHCIGFNEDSFRQIAADVVKTLIARQRGEPPDHMLNPDVLGDL